MVANNKIEEASACTKKYFRAASAENLLFWVISGINESKLISNPAQAPNQDEAETENKVPNIRVYKNNSREGLSKIRKGVKSHI